MRLRLTFDSVTIHCVIDETPTAEALAEVIPFTSNANTWGDEVYFRTPANASPEPEATDVVEPGTVCFWVEGSSLAIPFGPTPVSEGTECRLVTKVNVLGKMEEDPSTLAKVRSGDGVRAEVVSNVGD